MKTFISYVPLQPPEKLQARIYQAVDNQALAYGQPTCFPIVPVIHGYACPGEEIRVRAVVSDYPNAQANAEKLCREVEAVCAAKGVRCGEVELLREPYNDRLQTHLDTFQQLIDGIRDGDTLYACITYGSKPSPMVELMALRYARRLCRNVDVGCVAYGKLDHNTGDSQIYDVTALTLLDDIMGALAQAGVKDPRAVLQELIAL